MAIFGKLGKAIRPSKAADSFPPEQVQAASKGQEPFIENGEVSPVSPLWFLRGRHENESVEDFFKATDIALEESKRIGIPIYERDIGRAFGIHEKIPTGIDSKELFRKKFAKEANFVDYITTRRQSGLLSKRGAIESDLSENSQKTLNEIQREMPREASFVRKSRERAETIFAKSKDGAPISDFDKAKIKDYQIKRFFVDATVPLRQSLKAVNPNAAKTIADMDAARGEFLKQYWPSLEPFVNSLNTASKQGAFTKEDGTKYVPNSFKEINRLLSEYSFKKANIITPQTYSRGISALSELLGRDSAAYRKAGQSFDPDWFPQKVHPARLQEFQSIKDIGGDLDNPHFADWHLEPGDALTDYIGDRSAFIVRSEVLGKKLDEYAKQTIDERKAFLDTLKAKKEKMNPDNSDLPIVEGQIKEVMTELDEWAKGIKTVNEGKDFKAMSEFLSRTIFKTSGAFSQKETAKALESYFGYYSRKGPEWAKVLRQIEYGLGLSKVGPVFRQLEETVFSALNNPQYGVRLILNPKEMYLESKRIAESMFVKIPGGGTTLNVLPEIQGLVPRNSAGLWGKTFRTLTEPFRRMDQGVKPVVVHSALDGMKRDYLRGGAHLEALTRDIEKAFGANAENQVQSVLRGIEEGNLNNLDLTQYLLNKIQRWQPIRDIDMPQIYLQNPTSRLLYVFQTFMLNRVNFVANSLKDIIKNASLLSKSAMTSDFEKKVLAVEIQNNVQSLLAILGGYAAISAGLGGLFWLASGDRGRAKTASMHTMEAVGIPYPLRIGMDAALGSVFGTEDRGFSRWKVGDRKWSGLAADHIIPGGIATPLNIVQDVSRAYPGGAKFNQHTVRRLMSNLPGGDFISALSERL